MCPYCDALTYSFWLNWSILLLSYIWLLICAWEIVNKLRKSVFYNHLWERYFNPPFLLGGGYFKTVRTVLYPNENGTLSSWERYFTDFLLRFERGTKSMVYLIKYNDLFHILLFHTLYYTLTYTTHLLPTMILWGIQWYHVFYHFSLYICNDSCCFQTTY